MVLLVLMRAAGGGVADDGGFAQAAVQHHGPTARQTHGMVIAHLQCRCARVGAGQVDRAAVVRAELDRQDGVVAAARDDDISLVRQLRGRKSAVGDRQSGGSLEQGDQPDRAVTRTRDAISPGLVNDGGVELAGDRSLIPIGGHVPGAVGRQLPSKQSQGALYP
jgi:hypothetical protein